MLFLGRGFSSVSDSLSGGGNELKTLINSSVNECMTKQSCGGTAYRFFLLCWYVRISQNNTLFHCGNWFICITTIIKFCLTCFKLCLILNTRNISPFHNHVISVLHLLFQEPDIGLHGQVIGFLQQNLLVFTLNLSHEIVLLLRWTFIKSDYFSTARKQLQISVNWRNNRRSCENAWWVGMYTWYSGCAA